jgi:chemotaxis protein MotA
MLIIVGLVVVLSCTVVSFIMGQNYDVSMLRLLLHPAELIAIFGITLGAVLIATPLHVLKDTLSKIIQVMTGKTIGKTHYFELIGALYELFQAGRKSGLLALEEQFLLRPRALFFVNILPCWPPRTVSLLLSIV